MSQRNPMNERYQGDKVKGQTKKSAASAKPKTKAASSVYIRSTKKTPQEKKAERKAERQRAAELDRMYYNPPTKEYKDLRRIWWFLLIAAIILTFVSFFGQTRLPQTFTLITLVAAYGCIIGALYVDFSKIRKVRRKYQEDMMKRSNKAEKHAMEQAIKQEQMDREALMEEKKEKRKGFFNRKK